MHYVEHMGSSAFPKYTLKLFLFTITNLIIHKISKFSAIFFSEKYDLKIKIKNYSVAFLHLRKRAILFLADIANDNLRRLVRGYYSKKRQRRS